MASAKSKVRMISATRALTSRTGMPNKHFQNDIRSGFHGAVSNGSSWPRDRAALQPAGIAAVKNATASVAYPHASPPPAPRRPRVLNPPAAAIEQDRRADKGKVPAAT
jgi:hypothetical protein